MHPPILIIVILESVISPVLFYFVKKMHVNVVTLSGKTIVISVEPADTMMEVAQNIEEVSGIPKYMFMLTHNSKCIYLGARPSCNPSSSTEETISRVYALGSVTVVELGLKEDSKLNLVLNMRGD